MAVAKREGSQAPQVDCEAEWDLTGSGLDAGSHSSWDFTPSSQIESLFHRLRNLGTWTHFRFWSIGQQFSFLSDSVAGAFSVYW